MTQGGQRPTQSPRTVSIPPSTRPSAEHVRALEAAGLLEVTLLKKSVQRPLMSVWVGEDKNREKVLLTVVDACGTPAERDRVIGAAKSLLALSGTVGVQNVRRVLEDVDAFLSDFHSAGTAADLVVLRLPTLRKLDFASRVCGALVELHDAGLTHGCLCPENILLDDDMQPVVTEAGMVSIAGSLEGDAENVFGYGAYAAPETQRGAPDARSDVFSLGRLLTFIMLDRTPGETVDIMDVNAKDPAIAAIVRRCTGAPAERYESMAALAADLQRCRQLLVPSGEEIAKRPEQAPQGHTRPPTASAPTQAKAQRPTAGPRVDAPAVKWAAPWWVAAIAGAVLLASVAAAALALARSETTHATLVVATAAALVAITLVIPATTRVRLALAALGLAIAVVVDPIGLLSRLDSPDAGNRGAAARAFVLKGGKDLSGLRIQGADLSGLDLTGAKLRGVDATGATFARSKLNLADLDGMSFVLVHLEGADLTGVRLDKTYATSTATCDEATILPEGWYCGPTRTLRSGEPPQGK